MLATNSYVLVVFLCISDRDKAFEGGEYFSDQVGLFIKSWHVVFNPTKELPSRAPVWVQLSWFPLEFWRHDIFHLVVLLLGRPMGQSQ